MKKGVSIVISTTTSNNSRHFFVPRRILILASVIGAVAVLAIILAAVNYSRISYKAVEAELLKKRNTEIEREFSKITEIRKNLEAVEANNRKLRAMLGIEKTPAAVAAAGREPGVDIGPSDTLNGGGKNVPALMPTTGQISKKFEMGHAAIDIATPLFTPVIATASGRVTETGWDSTYGNYVIIEHSVNYTTFYGHLNSVIAKPHSAVKAGALVGTVGSSGKSTSPHLHYEVRFQGRPVDPMAYLPYYYEK